MSHLRRVVLLCLIPLWLPAAVEAGWVIEWDSAAVNGEGQRLGNQRATQSIAANRVRMQQPETITLIDYGKDRFTLINPAKSYFWTGSVDDYVRDMAAHRQEAMRERVSSLGQAEAIKRKRAESGEDAGRPSSTPRRFDKADLPPVSLTNTGQRETIAGYETEKYDVLVDGELFQEFWLAPALNLGADLDPAKYLAQQEKTGASMMGKAAKQHNALYHDPQYRALVEKGFVLKSVVHHLSGRFERVAVSVKQEDVPASAFEVPDGYRRVRLSDMFDPPPTPAPRPFTQPGANPSN